MTTQQAKEFVQAIARMKQYTIDASDDDLEDAIHALNHLITNAKHLCGDIDAPYVDR